MNNKEQKAGTTEQQLTTADDSRSASVEASPMLGAASLDELLSGVSVCYSRGRGRGGRRANFIRPSEDCFNKSRRVTGFTDEELDEKIIATVQKWYYPMRYYLVDGHLIGSNNEMNALKEYWRVCEKDYIGMIMRVQPAESVHK